jgi:hypothetical protein
MRSWNGIDGLGDQASKEKAYRNDYERACAIKDYLGLIPVSRSMGIVLGDMPLETTVMKSSRGRPRIIRVFYSEPDANIASIITPDSIPKKAKEVENINIHIAEPCWYMFDSAYPGYLGLERCLPFTLVTGDWCVKTFEFKPDKNTFLLVHEFDENSGRQSGL